MISRRSLVSTGAAALAATSLPVSGKSHLQHSTPVEWPEIQGPSIDRSGSHVIAGDGIRYLPEGPVWTATEMPFARNSSREPALALTEGVLVALGNEPRVGFVGIDAATGNQLWHHDQVSSLVGVADGVVLYSAEGPDDESHVMLRAMDVHSHTELWAVNAGEIEGAVVANANVLVTSESDGEDISIVARSLQKGVTLWNFDVTDWESQVPGILRSNGEVVIGSPPFAHSADFISAWDVESGEILWQFENTSIVGSPYFRGDDVVVISRDGLHTLAVDNGEQVNFFPVRYGVLWLVNTDEAALVNSPYELTAYSWETGDELWSRPFLNSRKATDLFVCDSVLYRVETRDETESKASTVSGYSVTDGRLVFEYTPHLLDHVTPEIAAVLVANGTLFVSTDQGVMTAPAGTKPIPQPVDPVLDRAFISGDYGFSYSWDASWEAIAVTEMTPNGLLYQNVEGNGWAAQYVGPASENNTNFEEKWHAALGRIQNVITGVRVMETPLLDFLPESATVLGVEYDSTYYQPFTTLYGLRVLIPLSDDNVLAFEFLQGDSLFDESLGAFATFFENLNVQNDKVNVRRPGNDSYVMPTGSD